MGIYYNYFVNSVAAVVVVQEYKTRMRRYVQSFCWKKLLRCAFRNVAADIIIYCTYFIVSCRNNKL